MSSPNHPCVVWGSVFLFLTSMFAITWALVIFFFMGDMLLVTGTDLVIALLLLSGIIMLPTNLHMMYAIAHGHKIHHRSTVLCCPLWMLIVWIIVINCLGTAICLHKICMCSANTQEIIMRGMTHYRSVPKSKRFMDNLQWSLKCCGMNSYKDWFHFDWYEKLRDYEWDPNKQKRREDKTKIAVSDSVPLSCCRSGTCVPNYLLELGTHSIHTKGCNNSMYRIYVISMNVHLIVFIMIVVTEIMLLSCIIGKGETDTLNCRSSAINVRHLMLNNKFEQMSSSSLCPEDSDIEDMRDFRAEPVPH